MLELVSKRVVGYLSRHNFIEEEERHSFIYASETLLIKIINWILALSISFMMGHVIESIFFMLCLVSIRKYSGGYHAKSAFRCVVMGNIIVIMVNHVMSYLDKVGYQGHISVGWYVGTTVFSCIIVALAPVRCENFYIEPEECLILKKKTCIVIIIMHAMVLTGVLCHAVSYALCIVLAIYIAGGASVAGYCKNWYRCKVRVHDDKYSNL